MNLWQWLCSLGVLVASLQIVTSVEDEKKSDKKAKKLQIGVKKRVDPEQCTIKSHKGDTLHMHYTVSCLSFCVPELTVQSI